MDHNITRLRAQDAAGEVAQNPSPSPADKRGQYEFPLIEVVRTVAQLAAQRDGMTLEQLQAAPCPLDPSSPLVLAARGALLERGYLADGTLPRFVKADRREDPSAGIQLPAGRSATLEDLRRIICGIGIVGNIDGHDVIRRGSVIDLIDRHREG